MTRGAVMEELPAGRSLPATGNEFQLLNPHPLAATLPGVYRDAWLDERRRTARESFGTRFISAFDTVLAPVLATLDNLESYLDPDTTPDDFLAWLGGWVAAPVDATWPEDRRRAFVAEAAELYRRRGTAAGLHDHVQIYTGGSVEIVENGASSWSAKPDGKLPGSPEPVVIVRVTVDDPDSIDKDRLDALVRASKPAHVVHRVEVIGVGQRAARKAKAPDPVVMDDADDDASTPGSTSAAGSTGPETPASKEPSSKAQSSKKAAADPDTVPDADAPTNAATPAPAERPAATDPGSDPEGEPGAESKPEA